MTTNYSIYKPQTLIKTEFQAYFLSILTFFCGYLSYDMHVEQDYLI